ncbi:MAG: hypothetical protein C6W57_02015 [Caldibacillus debilis]|nr:MAG: hypothetical protein C6W57_02015 [Caldibacillus debilis]
MAFFGTLAAAKRKGPQEVLSGSGGLLATEFKTGQTEEGMKRLSPLPPDSLPALKKRYPVP